MKLRNVGNIMFITIPICLMSSRKKGTEKTRNGTILILWVNFFIMKNMNSKLRSTK